MIIYHFYIYAYLRFNGTPYYIGKGSRNRSKTKAKWERISPPKNKNKIIVMESNLSELGAFALERRYIKWWGRKNIGTGILRNLTDGGEGGSGCKHTAEAKEKHRLAALGNKANMGRRFSIEHKNNLSKSHIGINTWRNGKHWSEEIKDKMRKAQKGKKLTSVHIENIKKAQRARRIRELSEGILDWTHR